PNFSTRILNPSQATEAQPVSRPRSLVLSFFALNRLFVQIFLDDGQRISQTSTSAPKGDSLRYDKQKGQE
ncbi:MAG TPA: hypothetical protein VIT18_03915, partial [Terrimicrobiaceae bacterium]